LSGVRQSKATWAQQAVGASDGKAGRVVTGGAGQLLRLDSHPGVSGRMMEQMQRQNIARLYEVLA